MRSLISLRLIPILFAVAIGGLCQEISPHLHIEHLLPATSGQFGSFIFPLSDRNGDGYQDFAVSAPTGPYPAATAELHVFSGRTGTLIRAFLGDQFLCQFGETVVGLGDVNGDSVPDLAVGAPHYTTTLNRQGRVFCFSGATGSVLWTRDGVEAFGDLGKAMQLIGDVSGDGRADLVVAEPRFGADDRGRVRTIVSSTGTPLGDSEGSIALAGFGGELVGRGGAVYAADLSGRIFAVVPGPGTLFPPLLHSAPATASLPEMALIANPSGGFDLAVGRRFEDPMGVTNAGTVTLYAGGGPTAMPLLLLAGSSIGEGVGLRVETAFDLDGDGAEEVLFAGGASGLDRLRVRAVSRTGVSVLDRIITGTPARIASLTDVTGDGRGEWLTGILSGVSSLSEANLWSGGLSPSAWTLGPAGLAATFAVDFGPAQALRLWVAGYSLSGSSPGLTVPGSPHLPINLDPLTTFLFEIAFLPGAPLVFGSLDSLGRTSIPLSLPSSTTTLLSQQELSLCVVAFLGTAPSAASNPLLLAFP